MSMVAYRKNFSSVNKNRNKTLLSVVLKILEKVMISLSLSSVDLEISFGIK